MGTNKSSDPFRCSILKYMYSGNYTAKGAAGLLNDGGKAREEEAEKAAASMGAPGGILVVLWGNGLHEDHQRAIRGDGDQVLPVRWRLRRLQR